REKATPSDPRPQSAAERNRSGQASDGERRMCVRMVVLGIDPGTASTGYGVVRSSGSQLRELAQGEIQTSPGIPLERRLIAIHERVSELLEAHAPDALAIEQLYFG